MDEFDRKLLRLIQTNSRATYDALAQEVNLSASAVRRRLQALRESGVIAREVAILDYDLTGFMVIVMVRCETESAAVYERFKARMRSCDEVLQCYSVSGDSDFIVVAHMLDMPTYNRWIHRYVIDDPDLNRCDTAFVFDTVKFETAITLQD